MKQVTEMSMLEILLREDKALKEMRHHGDLVMAYRNAGIDKYANKHIRLRDEALQQLNEARYDLKSYCNYYGIGKRR